VEIRLKTILRLVLFIPGSYEPNADGAAPPESLTAQPASAGGTTPNTGERRISMGTRRDWQQHLLRWVLPVLFRLRLWRIIKHLTLVEVAREKENTRLKHDG
jgi:hypothetical protein